MNPVAERLVRRYTPLVGELFARMGVQAGAKRLGKREAELTDADEPRLVALLNRAFSL